MLNKIETNGELNDRIESSMNIPMCYKCKRCNAIININGKLCRCCFFSHVEYKFKSTLREKCLFKHKISSNLCDVQDSEGIKGGGGDKDNKNNVIEKREEIENKSDYIEKLKKREEKKKTKQKKKTGIAFSGETCSCFLLHCFVKYLKNSNMKNDNLFLSNEHAIFSDIIFVDINEDKNYISNLISLVWDIFRSIEEKADGVCLKIDEDNINKEKVEEKLEEKLDYNFSDGNTAYPLSINNKDDIIFCNGVYKKKINKINLVVLKSNYFIKESNKKEFLVIYDLIKKKKHEKNDCLNFINELIIYNNILKYSINENIEYILLGNNANNICNKAFLYTIMGNGINIPLCTAYIDNRYTSVKMIKPLKELFVKEIYLYCFYKNISYLKNTMNNYVSSSRLYTTLYNVLSELNSNNNTTSIINSANNNLIDYDILININKNKNGNGNSNGITNGTTNGTTNGSTNTDHIQSKNSYSNYLLCHLCHGHKEALIEEEMLKRMNMTQIRNIKNIKSTVSTCATCLSTFSYNDDLVKFVNLFF
ncbi:cytoplasmic tRNA 2-thiolation protein 2, putative [Hepatocystis sp. ex Piliocolobus tephrosceles]|nr:cytoplasmic tRNA 2-thiolation protein 2, putative [Hepatocystis sp. ex Piliocolobus tephrosceles]